MEIKIDTKRDSAEDIKKTIDFLQRMIEQSSQETETPNASEGAFNMFGNNDYNSENKDDEDKDDAPNVSIVEY